MHKRSWMVVAAVAALAVGCRDRGGNEDGGPRPDGASGAENTAALCSDGIDNDGDSFEDCRDFDCCGRVTCGMDTTCGRRDGGGGECTPSGDENTQAACSDRVDNDCDGFTDCRDFSCGGFCPAENSNRACTDGQDNDGDNFTDCDDRDCQERIVCRAEVTNARCSDGMDNDNEDGADCADPNCQGEGIVVCDGSRPVSPLPAADQWAALVRTRCTNGVSEGTRAEIDCAEFSCLWNYPQCEPPPAERFNTACSDGNDDDLDGVVDCADPSCQEEGVSVCDGTTPVTPADPAAASNTECSNGLNEDEASEMAGRPFVDCADFSCNQNPDVTVCSGANTERNNTACSDGADNDSDGNIDCRDFDCSRNPAVTVCESESTFTECSNGMDDDGNMRVDCADFGCKPPMGTASPACI